MTIVYALVNLLILGSVTLLWWRRLEAGRLRQLFFPALLLKLLAGVALGLLYAYYYDGGDTWTYFEFGREVTDMARRNPGSFVRFLTAQAESSVAIHFAGLPPRALMMVKVSALVNLLTHDNYWISSLYFSFVSFAGSWFLVRTIVQYDDRLLNKAAIAFLFFPSVVFWSSGLLKESLAMAALCYISAVALKVWWRKPRSWWEGILSIAGLLALWEIKYYYLAVFLPLVIAGLAVERVLNDRKQPKPILWLGLLWIATLAIPLALISVSRPNFYPDRFLEVVTASNEAVRAYSDVEDVIHYQDLAPTMGSVVRNLPQALFSGLFRKLPWESRNVLQLISSIENLLLLMLTLAALRNITSLPVTRDRLLLFTVLTYCLVLCAFLALSTPNYGTLSRYRIGFLPFFVLLILLENPVLRWLTRKM
jgi:hypothetical protein